MDQEQYISIDECKDWHLYRIKARNADIGVYIAEEKGFKISRFKFGDNYIFIEYHWDTGEPFGTVKPLKEMGKISPMNDDELLTYLNSHIKNKPESKYKVFKLYRK